MTILDLLLKSPLLKKHPNAVIEYSKYVYTRRGVTDRRDILHVSFNSLHQVLQSAEKELKPNEELAIHSKVVIDNQTFHLPFIDFKVPNLNNNGEHGIAYQNIRKKLKHLTEETELFSDSGTYIINSGSSYHGFFDALLTKEQWIQFIAALLLEHNTVDHPIEVVDVRWVGHSLENGFSSLRITNNTGRYARKPALEREKVRMPVKV